MKINLLGVSKLPASARRPVLIKKAARLGLGRLSKKNAELNVLFVSDQDIRKINKAHLGHDYATDVIAFPYADAPFPGETPVFGDIVVSAERAKSQAKDLGHSVLKETLTLCAHGALHLAGHDDHQPKAKAKMFKKQDAILKTLKIG